MPTEHAENAETIRLTMGKLVHEKETYDILGACFEVYREIGCGFLEAVYQECVAIELGRRGIPFRSLVPLELRFKGQVLRKRYEADFICHDKVLVEIKAISALSDEHRAQIQNYLHATGLRVGLLVNFGHHPLVEHERFVL